MTERNSTIQNLEMQIKELADTIFEISNQRYKCCNITKNLKLDKEQDRELDYLICEGNLLIDKLLGKLMLLKIVNAVFEIGKQILFLLYSPFWFVLHCFILLFSLRKKFEAKNKCPRVFISNKDLQNQNISAFDKAMSNM